MPSQDGWLPDARRGDQLSQNMEKTMPDLKLPYHKDYGETDERRMEVLAYAEEHGVTAAAKRFHLGNSVIYKWRRAARRAGVCDMPSQRRLSPRRKAW